VRVGACCTAIFLYADDVITLAPSVCALQSLVNVCMTELQFLDLAVNTKKNLHVCVLALDIQVPVEMLV